MLKEHGQVDRANLHSEDHESAPQIAFFGAVAESLGPFQAFQVNIGWPHSFIFALGCIYKIFLEGVGHQNVDCRFS